ncbi:MAG: helix-turn-helix transcriptional regulator [Oscillospiraceae bacterium]|nr:helix-turn-helix transcriptional regulator [Oscillospiraceae bacterium]
MKEFGELIASKRKELGYTQEAFAGKLGITPQAVSKWENGVSQT